MPTCHLDDRSLFRLQGPEAESFLQNVITTDLSALGEGECRPSALLTPQGKILFDFLIFRSGEDALSIECRTDIAADLVKRLTLYKLRAKADISKPEQCVVAVSWETDSSSSQTDSTFLDRRFPDRLNVQRHYDAVPGADCDEAAFDRLRIANAVAESGRDYALGDAFPHDILYDQNGGVGLRKGCYVGQEVVSRMHHRGTARRRLLIARAADRLPETGTELKSGGKPVGVLGTVSSSDALAIARIDRVKDAMDARSPVTAGDVEVACSIPAWASFSFPQSGGDGG